MGVGENVRCVCAERVRPRVKSKPALSPPAFGAARLVASQPSSALEFQNPSQLSAVPLALKAHRAQLPLAWLSTCPHRLAASRAGPVGESARCAAPCTPRPSQSSDITRPPPSRSPSSPHHFHFGHRAVGISKRIFHSPPAHPHVLVRPPHRRRCRHRNNERR